jgi:hypothetical protein
MKNLLLAAATAFAVAGLTTISLVSVAHAHRQVKAPPPVPPPIECQGKDWTKCFWEETQKYGGG